MSSQRHRLYGDLLSRDWTDETVLPNVCPSTTSHGWWTILLCYIARILFYAFDTLFLAVGNNYVVLMSQRNIITIIMP